MLEGKQSHKESPRRAAMLARVLASGAAACLILAAAVLWAQTTATDPGVRGIGWCTTGCAVSVGGFESNLTPQEVVSEPAGTTQFQTTAVVTGGPVAGNGLGPRFSSNSCVSCHQQPGPGGSSPLSNPLFQVYQLNNAQNTMPSFETASGPVLVPRFPFQPDGVTPDGMVHQLFVVTGRSDAQGCTIQQPNFAQAASQNNLVFRQPLPVFGDGEVEFIQNSDILKNLSANQSLKMSLGIGGVANITADGSVSRFGWKAQWRAVLPAIGAEEQVEEGITNEMLPTEIDQTPGCGLNPIPEDPENYAYYSSTNTPWLFTANVERDDIFIRFLQQPREGQNCPGGNQTSCANGLTQFNKIGCGLCHTQSFRTPAASIPSQGHLLLPLYSDLVLHHMGSCLADNIVQGSAQGDMWRTPPLWNVGQRIWFMHDARTNNMVQAIEDHADGFCTGTTGVGTYPASEADAVVNAFNALANTKGVAGTAQQDLINFLRSL